jgi:hypothetical protein
MEQVPIIDATSAQKGSIIKRIKLIQKDPTNHKVQALESEIDELIFDLYGLTATERRLIRDQTKARRGSAGNADVEESD